MSENTFRLVLCTNGHEPTRPALDYGIWLAGLLQAPVLLLGVLEHEEDRQTLDRLLAETAGRLAGEGIEFEQLVRTGRASIQISEQVCDGNSLTVFGPFGRPLWRRWVRGRTFRRLLARISTPMIYVPEARIPLKQALVCMGGLGHAFSMEHLVLNLARVTGASITLLNVVEPVTLAYPVAQEVHTHLDALLKTDTPQGRNLSLALEEARGEGLEVKMKVRHGSVVSEILEEVREGDYDLVGLGSPYSAQSLRHLYMPNVTAEVAEAIDRPVLTVRSGEDVTIWNKLYSGNP